MLVTLVTVFLLTLTGLAYWLVRQARIRRHKVALQVCANREESARATCWSSMMTIAELLRFENPDAEEPKQIHRRLVRHVQSSRSTKSDHAELTIEMLEVLLDLSSRQLRHDHAEARARMVNAANAWRKTQHARITAEQALATSRRVSWVDPSASATPQSETALPS